MMLKYKTLQRRQGERLRAYWSRYIAFYEENRIKTGDKLKVDGATATEDSNENILYYSHYLIHFFAI